MSATFVSVPVIESGAGAFERLGELVAPLGRRALVVTGRAAMREAGFLDRALALLGAAGVDAAVHEGVPPEPPLAAVDDARAAAQEARAGIVIGLGGGSALDVAKAAAALVKESEPTAAYFHGRGLTAGAAAFVGVPSTFGTGTEVTPNSVLIDPEARRKKSIRDERLRARVAVVDPRLGMGAPARTKAESGMDALTQAIEGFFSLHSTPVTESLSFGAVALLAASLADFVADPADEEAAESCATGSLMAGMAFANARLGLIHGVVHPLGALYGAPHGRLCGSLLPAALRYNRDAVPGQYALLCGIVKRDIADFCEELLQRVGLPADLQDLSLREEDLPAIVATAMTSSSLQANPRTVTEADLEALLRRAAAL
jgi:alcohol dehydrogenase class IV